MKRMTTQPAVDVKPAALGDPAPPEVTQQTDPDASSPPVSGDPPAVTQLEPAAPLEVDPAAPVDPVPSAPPVPTVGRTVHYMLPVTEEIRPAVIVGVYIDERVDLQVFTNSEVDKRAIVERVVMLNVSNGVEIHQVPSMVSRHRVTMGTDPGQWSWPART